VHPIKQLARLTGKHKAGVQLERDKLGIGKLLQRWTCELTMKVWVD